MLEKIEKFKPWLIVILIYLIFHLLIVGLMELTGGHSWFQRYIYLFVLPAFQTMLSSIMTSISEFSGDTLQTEYLIRHTIITGTGILIVFIITPFLLIKGYLTADKTFNQKRGIAWYVGACLFLLIIGVTSVNLARDSMGFFKMNDINAANSKTIASSRNTSDLRYELTALALDASALSILPNEYGGGNGTFTNFVGENGETKTLSLEQLKSYESVDSNHEFYIHPKVSDSSITIVGISDFEGRNENFKNINGEIGKKQMSVKIHPYQENIYHMDKDSLSN